jgi:hypothetical protein
MKGTVIPEKIRIKNIAVLKSSVDVGTEAIEIIPSINEYSFSFNQEIGFNYDQQLVRLKLNILLQGKNDKKELVKIKGEFGIEFVFQVENFKELTKEENGSYEISSSLVMTLSSLAYSTSRGIVFQETQSTIIRGVLLPVIDPAVLYSPDKKQVINDVESK